jgi:hypothetical protein
LHAPINLASDWNLPIPKDLKIGGILGMADLVNVVDFHSSSWYEKGKYGWIFKNTRSVAFFKCRGYPGLFDIEYPYNL